VAVSVVKDVAIKAAIETGAEMVTGLKLTMSGFSAGIVRSVVDIRGLKLHNPKDFPDPVMVDMPEIYVDYDLPAIFGGTIHLKEVRINLAEFTVVKNRSRRLNLDSLKAIAAQKQGAQAEDKAGRPMKMRIDLLKLKIGKAVYKDYSAGGAPSVKEFNVGIDETFTNIDNPNTLVSLIVVKALMNTSIGNLAHFDVGSLSRSVSSSLESAAKAVAAAHETVTKTIADTKAAAESAKATVDAASATAKGAADTAKKTAESLGGLFKGLGSSKE
jgi:pyridoxal/pyridoxine/pyridoxamine kinase